MDANTYYLAQHQAEEVKSELKAELIEALTVEIYNRYFDNLDGDFYSQIFDGGPCVPGENCYDHLQAMPYKSFALIASAVKSKDFIEIGKVVFDELTKQIMADAKWQEEK